MKRFELSRNTPNPTVDVTLSGLQVSSDLSWHPHVRSLLTKLAISYFVLRRLVSCLSRPILLEVLEIYALVESHIRNLGLLTIHSMFAIKVILYVKNNISEFPAAAHSYDMRNRHNLATERLRLTTSPAANVTHLGAKMFNCLSPRLRSLSCITLKKKS
ncbi:hypothetical protein GE061_014897 [Apolygus lucorum]|uniref:Uncharacterized protein n=1 Tax=Apolygus lucorum TaxID=248454 RepID=A0A8S9XJI6_APOLU|nr:hypothetical protein GE061_014897 [Apolygus lucorum]